MVPLQGAGFMALLVPVLVLVLVGAGSTVRGTVIPDPQNVMIKCENQIPMVHWDYSHQQPQTIFRVEISGSAGKAEYNTTDHQFDLSRFIWKSEDRYMAYHFVTVTALMEGNESKPVQTKSFSFNQLKTVDVKCGLDFPPVNLTVDKSEATVRFWNPFSFYPELKQADKPNSAFFAFWLSVSNITYEARCGVDQITCRYDFPFPYNMETCIKLKGWLFEGNEVGYVEFRETEDVCPSSSVVADYHWVVVILMLVVFVIVVLIISFIVYKVGAWTLKTPPLPEPLLPPEPNLRNLERYPMLDSDAVMSHVQVVDIRASLDSMEEEKVSPTATPWHGSSGPGPQNPPRDSCYTDRWLSDSSSSSQEAMGLMSEGQRTDDDSANGSVETESVSMSSTEEEEEGEAVSPYDRPHVVQIDLGNGDTVIAYTGS